MVKDRQGKHRLRCAECDCGEYQLAKEGTAHDCDYCGHKPTAHAEMRVPAGPCKTTDCTCAQYSYEASEYPACSYCAHANTEHSESAPRTLGSIFSSVRTHHTHARIHTHICITLSLTRTHIAYATHHWYR